MTAQASSQKRTHYIVVEDFGALGRCYIETDWDEASSLDRVVRDLIERQIERPVKIIAFDPDACDVSAKIAAAVVDEAWKSNLELSEPLCDFVEAFGEVVPTIKFVR